MALLSRQDPVLDQILFYEDVPLFEDELHDNGESILNVRIVSRSVFFVWFRIELLIWLIERSARHAAFIFHPLKTFRTS